MINDILYANARKYGLTGTDAMVFEALVYLCRSTGEWKGSYTELARFSCCGSHQTAMRAVNKLVQNGLVVVQNGLITVQNGLISKEERRKEENIKNNKSMHASLFESFWALYDSDKKWSRSKHRTRQLFEQLPEDWQRLAIEKAKDPPPDRDPYWYLKDEDFLRVGYGKKEAPAEEPTNYNRKDLEPGVKYVSAKYKGAFGLYTEADVRKFGMELPE